MHISRLKQRKKLRVLMAATLAASSMATGPLKEGLVYGGNPCRVIKERFAQPAAEDFPASLQR
jgi:acetyltransferase-like isoleucine patch superfamily enzyme